ncbi:MAG: tRNA (adenosine(37)-N6)-threonylcarbamoyltransferase complex dimerization subunit type 1 TsaB, partial [Inquilinus sp.]|nr:tRNA (adenosine(37)-N6)-threonylcarbamoyltransferase complex dimerization subunit type 1 TsaB [Inquilinus sp.]
MIVLALDTAGSACSVALWRDGEVIAARSLPLARGHAEALMPMVREVAAAAAIDLATPDLFAVAIGPGAFTGLRIGIAAAAGMALAANRPILGISSLEIAAHAVPVAERQRRDVLVVLDSRREELFVQLFDSDLAPLGGPACSAPAGLAALCGDRPLTVTGD